MKRRYLLYLIFTNPSLMIGQSVYMHEAQEESGNLFDAILGFLIFFGIIYLINKIVEVHKQNRVIKEEQKRKFTLADEVAKKTLESNNIFSKYQNKESWQRGFKKAEYDKLQNCVRNFDNIKIEDLIKKYRDTCEAGHIIQAEKIMEDIGYYQNIFPNVPHKSTAEKPSRVYTVQEPSLHPESDPIIRKETVNTPIDSKIKLELVSNTNKNPQLNPTRILSSNFSRNKVLAPQNEMLITKSSPIDLGLSVFWADCNVGAQNPEEYGRYFAWGEIKNSEKWVYPRRYNSEMISLKQLQSTQNKYFCNISGINKYDAANYNMGTEWRLPTKEELEELIQQCNWERTIINGIKVIKLTGKNGISIFLPCAGHWIVEHPAFVGEEATIWSSSPYIRENSDSIREAYYLQFSTTSIFGDGPKIITTQCSIPFTIRAVKDKIK